MEIREILYKHFAKVATHPELNEAEAEIKKSYIKKSEVEDILENINVSMEDFTPEEYVENFLSTVREELSQSDLSERIKDSIPNDSVGELNQELVSERMEGKK